MAAKLDREQALELRVAILLDDENPLVLLNELGHLVSERVGAYAAVVDVDAARGEPVERLADRAVGAADADESPLHRFGRAPDDGLRNELCRGAPFSRQPIDDLLVLGRVFGIEPELVVARAAHEVRALRMHAGQSSIGNSVAVDVDVAME